MSKGLLYRAVLLACGLTMAPAFAGPLSPELLEMLRGSDGQERVAVIISFAARVDPGQFTQSDRTARNAALLTALRARAAESQGPLVELLAARGIGSVRQLWVNNSLAVELPAAMIPAVAALPGVAAIRPDATVTAPQPSTGTTAEIEWNIQAVHAPDLWTLGYRGEGVVVAAMDTGVDGAHPELAARWRGGGNSWYDPNGEHAAPHDAHGHGTQVMGILVGGAAGGSAMGVAPQAQWIAVKLFNDAGATTLSRIHQGFQWLLDPDGDPLTPDAPQVVNNSWGLQNGGTCNLEFNEDIRVLKTAGIHVVFAAGNGGPAPFSDESPANNPEAFAVGAVDGAGTLADFSSRGPSACDGSTFPEVTAPGADVYTSDLSFGGLPLYVRANGTSFAAPHVSGALALLAGAAPRSEAAARERALRDSARDAGDPGADSGYGYGVIDVLAAYQALAAGAPPTPNQPPLTADDSYRTIAGATLTVTAPGVLQNDRDPEAAPLTATLVTPPAGALTFNGDGSFSYTPTPGTVSDSFTYQASDGSTPGNPATVTIAIDQPPVASGESYSVKAGTTLNQAAPGLLVNDSDPEGAPLSAALVDPPTGGSLTLRSDGSFSYTPAAGTTSDSFSYRVNDGAQWSAPAQVKLSIATPVNRPPIARGDRATTRRNQSVVINVLANDTDADGRLAPSSVTVVAAPNRGGRAVVQQDGRIGYTPRSNFTGIESFGYTVKDNRGAVSRKAVVSVSVRP